MLQLKIDKISIQLEGAILGHSQETTTQQNHLMFQPISTIDGHPKWHDTCIRLIEWHLNTSSMYGFDCSTVEYILEAGFCMCHMFRFVAKRCVMMSYNAFHKGWPNELAVLLDRTTKQAAISHLFRDSKTQTLHDVALFILHTKLFSWETIHISSKSYQTFCSSSGKSFLNFI